MNIIGEDGWEVPKRKAKLGDYMNVFALDYETKNQINVVNKENKWERIRIQVDSGAIDTVGPKDVAKAFNMEQSEMSIEGVGFIAANGSSIKNYGEK